MRVIPWEVYSDKKISQRESEIIVGTILGDAHLARMKLETRLEIAHSVAQKELVFWKYKELKRFTSALPHKISFFDGRYNKKYTQWRFKTRGNKIFSFLYRKFYSKKGRKQISSDIRKWIQSPLTLAVWFMDDGGRRNDCYGIFLNTLSFTKKENEILQKCLKKNFSLDSRIHWIGDGYRLYIPSKNIIRFCSLVYPYILSSLRYKLPYNPVTTSFART